MFRIELILPTILIIECTRCGGLLLSNESQKTKTCTYCSARIQVYKAKKLSSAKNAYDASAMLKNFKNIKKFK